MKPIIKVCVAIIAFVLIVGVESTCMDTFLTRHQDSPVEFKVSKTNREGKKAVKWRVDESAVSFLGMRFNRYRRCYHTNLLRREYSNRPYDAKRTHYYTAEEYRYLVEKVKTVRDFEAYNNEQDSIYQQNNVWRRTINEKRKRKEMVEGEWEKALEEK